MDTRTSSRKRGPLGRTGLYACVLVCALAIPLSFAAVGNAVKVHAAQAAFNEYSVKAGFLYNFAKFISWPEGAFETPQSPIIICILGNDPFQENLVFLGSKTVRGRQLVVRKLPGIEQASRCNTVFIGKTERARVPGILNALKASSILTIGETDNFCTSGGVINLFTENNMVRFEINLDAAERAGLVIRSELLKLARIVREDR